MPKDEEGLAALSDAERNALGATLKDRGNKLYSKKEFKKAVECYSKAIDVSVKKDAVFYSNRAACECCARRVGNSQPRRPISHRC